MEIVKVIWIWKSFDYAILNPSKSFWVEIKEIPSMNFVFLWFFYIMELISFENHWNCKSYSNLKEFEFFQFEIAALTEIEKFL